MSKILKRFTAVFAVFAITAMCLPCMPDIIAEASTTSTYIGENLLADYDSDFEGSALSPKWTANTGSVATLSTEQKKSGNQSLKITVTQNQKVGPTAASLTLKAGKTYLFSAYIYPLKSDKYRLRVTGTTPWRTCTVNQWNHLAEVVSVSNDTNVSLYFQNATGSSYSGTVYVDNIEVYEIELGDNLLSDRDPDFETIDVSTYTTDGNSPYWNVRGFTSVANTAEQKKSGSKSVKVDRSGNGQQVGLMAENVSFSADKRYYASAWVYSDKTAKYRLRVQADGFTDANEQVWINATANTWTQIHAVTNCTKDSAGYFYIQAETAENSDIVYIDNFELYDITPPTTTVASPLNGAEKVSVNTDLKLVFSQTVGSVSASNIEGVAAVNITTADNKTFIVDLGTLDTNTTYNAKVTGVVDKNGKAVADKTFIFKTASFAGYTNIMADYDPSFEAGEPDTTMWKYNNSAGKATIVRTTAKAHTGDYSIFRSGADYGYRGIYAQPVLEEDTNYYASLWVYSEVADTARLRIQNVDGENMPSVKNLPKGQWTQFDAIIGTTGAKDLSKPMFYIGTTGTGNIYVDDFELLKIGKILKGKNGLELDSKLNTLDVTEIRTESYASMSDIANDIEGSSDYDITIADTDENGKWSDGDVIKFVSKSAGSEYTYSYTVNVIDYYECETQAFIVKGSDGLGDDFSRVDTITKAGNAFVEYRLTNNSGESITPAVAMASYDESGRLTDIDVIDNKTIADGSYFDFEFDTVVPSAADGAQIKLMVWENMTSMEPLMPAKVYTVETNDFTVPNVISDNMVLQRNSDAVVFGKAPQGSTITASLSGGITASYTVPSGDNEFFVKLPMEEYSTTEQTLTITAEKRGETLGTITREGILVGDVYYGGGQSNMARQFKQTASDIQNGLCSTHSENEYDGYVEGYKALAAKLNGKKVRFFKTMTERTTTSRDSWDQTELAKREVWKQIDASNIEETYETMVRMADSIYALTAENSEVPIGIVACAQGGTEIAKWVSRDALLNSGNFGKTFIDEYEDNIKKVTEPSYWASHTDLYYDGVRSVMPYTVKAAVWYQGESDSAEENPSDYDKYLKAMIADMRKGMKNENLPYLIVQLPGYDSGSWSDAWPEMRLLQWNAQTLGNVYTVVTNDSGDNNNIHPANKELVGERLARTMLAKVFGENVAYTGPTFKSVAYDEGVATITVDTYGGTLEKSVTTIGSPAFQLTTDEGKTWTAANSVTVSGDTIIVSNNSIEGVVNGVRYAYVEGVLKCINGDFDGVKLPLVPFDTTFVFKKLN